jgi:predicted glutamine amidotransferase
VARLLFSNLLWISYTENNEHGTGYAAIGPKDTWYYKTGESSADHVFGEEYLEFMEDHCKDSLLLVGHTRLASTTWRNNNQKVFPDWAAHPFEVGNGVLLFHNGFFEEHKRIAQEYGLKTGEYTDTMAFLEILKETTQDGALVNADTITAALEKAGECEYAMLITEPSGTLWAVRGVRTLHLIDTNYGILINTRKDNIENAVMRTNHVCRLFNLAEVEYDEVKALKEWTIHRIEKDEIVEWYDISALKEVNSPPKAVVRLGNGAGRYSAATVGDNELLDIAEIIDKTIVYLSISDLVPMLVTDKDIQLLLKEMIGGPSDGWWDYSMADLKEVHDILRTFWDKNPEYAPSDDKDELWEYICTELPKNTYITAKKFVPDFVFPYFHNTVDELRAVVAGLRK